MKTVVRKMIAVGAGLLLTTNVAVFGAVLYSDAATDTSSSLSFANTTTVGDEIQLSPTAPSYTLSSFTFEYYSPNSTFSGSVQMDVSLNANDGDVGTPNGYGYQNTPNTSLFDSGSFTLQTPAQNLGAGHNYATLTFSGLSVTVPQDFTLTLKVTGLVGGDAAGVELFSSPTVGQNNGEYWWNDGSGWRLNTLGTPGTQTGFGAQFTGVSAVPEPKAAGAIAGAGLLALCSLRILRQSRFLRNI